MIIEFRVANYRSIREEQALSFVAGAGKALENPDHRFDTPEKKPQKLVKSICLYGANASGKSNLLLALRVMIRLIRESNHNHLGDPIMDIEPFAFDATSLSEPTTLELTFIAPFDGQPTRFQYGFKIDESRIHEEWLYTYPKGYARCLLHREPGNEGKEWDGAAAKGIYKQIASRTNNNTLFLRLKHPKNPASSPQA